MKVFDAGGCGAATCSPLWTTSATLAFGPPSVANGVVSTTTAAGPTEAWPAAGCGAPTCDALWSSATPFDGTAAPFVADGRWFVGANQIPTYVLPVAG